jgi:phosphoribosyl-ATP pyrophosphohydrolase
MTAPAADAGGLFRRLEQVLEERIRHRPPGSYVAQLLDGGHPAMAGKVVEEAYELIEACAEEDRPAAIHEAADLVFHLLVLLRANGIRWDDVEAELDRRFGVGGLADKRRRPARGP